MSFAAVCSKCKLEKDCVEFHPAPSSRKKNKLQSQCKSCANASGRVSLKKRSAEYRNKINEIKLQRGCMDCGYNEASEALDFDHLRDKSFGLSYGYNLNWNDVLIEMEKCEIVCANCHRIRTKKRINELRKSAG